MHVREGQAQSWQLGQEHRSSCCAAFILAADLLRDLSREVKQDKLRQINGWISLRVKSESFVSCLLPFTAYESGTVLSFASAIQH